MRFGRYRRADGLALQRLRCKNCGRIIVPGIQEETRRLRLQSKFHEGLRIIVEEAGGNLPRATQGNFGKRKGIIPLKIIAKRLGVNKNTLTLWASRWRKYYRDSTRGFFNETVLSIDGIDKEKFS